MVFMGNVSLSLCLLVISVNLVSGKVIYVGSVSDVNIFEVVFV